MTTTTSAPKKKSALRRSIGMLRPHLRGQGSLMSAGVLVLLAEVLFRVLEPWPVKFVIDAVSRSLGADLPPGPAASVPLLAACGIGLIAIVSLRALSNYLATVAFALVGSRVATALRGQVFRHVQALSPRYHATSSSGDTVQRLVGDVGRLQEVAITAGLPLLANTITLVAMTGVMAWLDPLLAVVVVCAVTSYRLISWRSAGNITVAARKTRQGEGALANIAQESLGAITVVQAYGLQSAVSGKFERSNKRALREGVVAKRLAAALERRTDVVVGVATAAVLTWGGWLVNSGDMTPGDLVIFLMYLKTAMKPLRDLAKYTGRIARASASGERIADLLAEPIDIHDMTDATVLASARGEVRLERVWASYRDGSDVLRGVDLHIRPGERVSIVGHSGSGKSTLVSLLARMLDPTSGTVRVDGHDVRTLTLASLREQIALVLQESVLFSGTIRENIRYGRLDAGDDEIEEAARRAEAHSFILETPDGYATVVGERGGTLSGGQRQRIAIARAMLRDASIIVLDEATAGLDPASTALVLGALDELTAGRTSITVTHDLDTALRSDRILWLENGRIILDGTPECLFAEPDGRFARWLAGADQAGDPRPMGSYRSRSTPHVPSNRVAESESRKSDEPRER